MTADLEQGDVAKTVRQFCKGCASHSTLTLEQVVLVLLVRAGYLHWIYILLLCFYT